MLTWNLKEKGEGCRKNNFPLILNEQLNFLISKDAALIEAGGSYLISRNSARRTLKILW